MDYLSYIVCRNGRILYISFKISIIYFSCFDTFKHKSTQKPNAFFQNTYIYMPKNQINTYAQTWTTYIHRTKVPKSLYGVRTHWTP